MHRLNLGAPGIYPYPEQPPRVLAGVRLDVCAFVGVAPRGPARVPVLEEGWVADRPCVEPDRLRQRSVAVAVESFAEYRRLYGGFSGPGRLPFAVAAFFEQGGRRAWVVRIVHDYGDPVLDAGGVARGKLGEAQASSGEPWLRARNEGSWGNGLRAALGFSTRPLQLEETAPDEVTLGAAELALPPGTLLRLRLSDGTPELCFVTSVLRQARPNRPGFVQRAALDHALAEAPLPAAEIVEGCLAVAHAGEAGLVEQHEQLGLSCLHPRWLATVLCYESELVYPEQQWTTAHLLPLDAEDLPSEPLLPHPSLGDEHPAQFSGGEDRYPDIVPSDLFDALWTTGDPDPGDGIHALTHLPDLASVVVPDLYSPEPLPPPDIPGEEVCSLAGPRFAPCVDVELSGEPAQAAPVPLSGLHLDPALPADLEVITCLQQRLVELAERLRSWVVLLDVPPGLSQRRVEAWRARFSSSYAAAYHPWLRVWRPEAGRSSLLALNPAAAAAGIIARQELQHGVPHGPANRLVEGVVDVSEEVSGAQHDLLHPLGINVFLRERDGIRLMAARTTAADPRLRQLSVRRLLLLLRRVLEQQTGWLVFEPNGPSLRADISRMLHSYLRRLFQTGAFRGASPEEAFFVRCDDELNPQRVSDAGRLVAEIGVRPAEPIEFIVLRLLREGESTIIEEV